MAGLVGGQLAQVAEAELGVARRRLAPQPVPLVELREEEPQHRRLELVEPRVVADDSKSSSPREPWKRSMRTRSASSASLDGDRPPSPSANRFFVGKKLKVEATPVVAMPGRRTPARRPR